MRRLRSILQSAEPHDERKTEANEAASVDRGTYRWLDPRTAGPRLLSASVLAGPREEPDAAADLRRIRKLRATEKLERARNALSPPESSARKGAEPHHDPAMATWTAERRAEWLRSENTAAELAERLRDDAAVRERLALSRLAAASAAVRRGSASCREENLRSAAESEAERLRRRNPPPVPVSTPLKSS